MQLALVFTMLSLGITSLISIQSTVLGFYLMWNNMLPMGEVFGLFLIVFGLKSLHRLAKSSYFSRSGRTQLQTFIRQLV